MTTSANRGKQDAVDLEVGRLMRLIFERGPGSLHVMFDVVQHDTYDEPEPEWLLSALGRPAGPAGRKTGFQQSLLSALRQIAGGAVVEKRLCTACDKERPVAEFRRTSRKSGDGSAGAYRSVCRKCRRRQDEKLRAEGRRA